MVADSVSLQVRKARHSGARQCGGWRRRARSKEVCRAGLARASGTAGWHERVRGREGDDGAVAEICRFK